MPPDPDTDNITHAASNGGKSEREAKTAARKAKKRVEQEQLDRKLLNAIGSGEVVEVTPAEWEQIRRSVDKRLANKALGQ